MKKMFFILTLLATFLTLALAQNLKISQLTPLLNSQLASNDLTVAVDTSAGSTKSLSIGELDLRWVFTATSPLSKTAGASPVISIPKGTASVDGYLGSADFTTFNDKQAAVSATSPVVFSSNIISMPAATTSVPGYLTSSDWTTFNSKQATLPAATASVDGYLTSGDWSIFNAKQPLLAAASTSVSGYLLSADWTTFNNKQNTLVASTNSLDGYLTSGDHTLFNAKQATVSATAPVVFSANNISMAAATTSVPGYLTSSDWTTFNAKQATVSATSPVVFSSNIISMPAATTTVHGYLTSNDWTTFNNKQATLAAASTSVSGYLLSADWTTFNAKAPAFSATAPITYSANVIAMPAATNSVDGYLTSSDHTLFASAAGVSDGDKGDVVVSSTGTVWTLDAAVAATLVTAASQDVSSTTLNAAIAELGREKETRTFATTAAAGGAATLVSTDASIQQITGTNTHTFTLPVTSTLLLGQSFTIINATTGGWSQQVKSSGANFFPNIVPNYTAKFTCVLLTGTNITSWAVSYYPNTTSDTIVPTTASGALAATTLSTALAELETEKQPRTYTTTVTSGSPVTLTSSSNYTQIFTGSTQQSVVLPSTATLTLGYGYRIFNNSTARMGITYSGGSIGSIAWIGPRSSADVYCINTGSDAASSWAYIWNNDFTALTSITTAGGTTTIDSETSGRLFNFTGSSNQNVNLPATNVGSGNNNFAHLGDVYTISNTSTGVVTVRTSSSTNLVALGQNQSATFTIVIRGGGGAVADWAVAIGTVTDAQLLTSDVTTNNFTTSKHGFVPKGTNVGNFLKDDGTWAAAGSGGVSNSDVIVANGNGYGSTNTKIRRFTNSTTNGTGITYADSAANGASFTIAEAGVYSINRCDYYSATNADVGLSVNSSQLGTNVSTITAANRLAIFEMPTITTTAVASSGASAGCIGVSKYFAVNDVIRPHDNIANDDTGVYSWMRVTKVGGGGSGDMILANDQNVTEIKRFTDGKLILNGATSGNLILKAAAISASSDITFPAGVNDTAMTTSSDQTVTGLKQITDGKLALKGSASSYTILRSAAAAASADITLPTGTDTLVGLAAVQTLTGAKTMSADLTVSGTNNFQGRIKPREQQITTSAAPTPVSNSEDLLTVTALSDATATIGSPGGAPVDGQKLIIRIKSDGTIRTLAWNAIYRASSDLALPLATVASKTQYFMFMYNNDDTKWDFMAFLGNF